MYLNERKIKNKDTVRAVKIITNLEYVFCFFVLSTKLT